MLILLKAIDVWDCHFATLYYYCEPVIYYLLFTNMVLLITLPHCCAAP